MKRALRCAGPCLQRLLMEEAGLSFKELLYMSRWGAYAPRVAELAELPITGRRKGAAAQLKDRKLDGDAQPSARSVPTSALRQQTPRPMPLPKAQHVSPWGTWKASSVTQGACLPVIRQQIRAARCKQAPV